MSSVTESEAKKTRSRLEIQTLPDVKYWVSVSR